MVKEIAVRPADELPYQFGNILQIGNIMEALGAWRKEREGIAGKWYDDVKAYFTDGVPGRAITGRDLQEYIPGVGYVTRPSPLDITSPAYPIATLIQIGEGISELLNPQPEPNEADKRFEQWLASRSVLKKMLEKAEETRGTVGEPLSYAQLRDIAKLGGDVYNINGGENYFRYIKDCNERRNMAESANYEGESKMPVKPGDPDEYIEERKVTIRMKK